MNEEERADWLARAIDDLLSSDRQRPKEPPPPELERDELNNLMRVAEDRLDTSQTRMQAGLQYEGEVWKGVLRKLDRRRRPRKVKRAKPPAAIPPDDQFSLERDLEQFEIDELRDIAKMRRQLAEEAAAIAEAHRDDVWEKVQSRLWPGEEIAAEPERRRFPFTRRKEAVEPPDFLRIDTKDKEPSSDDHAEMGGLMDLARNRRYWSQLTKDAAGARRERVWTRVSRTIIRDKRDEQAEPTGGITWWPQAAAVAALVTLLAAALGPLPATGFADHPFLEFGRTVAEHVGVRETAPPAITSGEPVTLAGQDVTAAGASALLGVAVAEPQAPEGYALQASRFFEEALTADSGGAFMLTYAGPGEASVAVYQERASGADLAVEGGTAVDLVLKDGTAATYVVGAWQPVDGGLTWSDSAGQALVFERDGLRTTVQYTGPQASAPSLFALADRLIAPAE
jgi:hypothetical protein